MANPAAPPTGFHVDLPAGGKLVLKTQDEVDMWDQTRDAYIQDYRLAKTNDLVLLGAILTQNLAMFRAQQRMNGMEPELDSADVPTGRYKQVPVKAADITGAQKQIISASEEIRQLEKALGIDKKTREAGGAYNVADYIATLKKAGHQMGVHLTKRQKAYEAVMMEARWKVRLFRNGDPEDRQHHAISPENIIDWLEEEMEKLEDLDRKFANEVGKLYVGKL
jgi:hypothetical protein